MIITSQNLHIPDYFPGYIHFNFSRSFKKYLRWLACFKTIWFFTL